MSDTLSLFGEELDAVPSPSFEPETRYPLGEAFDAARLVREEFLRGDLAAVWIAGSIRRRKPEVKDIELVVVPSFDEGVAGWQAGQRLENAVVRGLQERIWTFDTSVKRNGEAYKRLRLLSPAPPMAIDLFIAKPWNAGNILAIRTGSSHWSTAMAMVMKGGKRVRQQEGALWNVTYAIPTRIDCHTEEQFLVLGGLPYIAPEWRTQENAERLLARQPMRDDTGHLLPSWDGLEWWERELR